MKRLRQQFISFFIIFMVSALVLIFFNAIGQYNNALSTTSEKLGIPVLERAAAVIDGDSFEQLAADLDPNDPYYEKTRIKLNEILNESSIMYLYTMAQYDNGIHRFIIDATDPADPNFSQLGRVEDVSQYSDAFFLAYSTGQVQSDRIDKKTMWGHTVSAIAPIFNSDAKVVGIIACDFDATDIYSNIFSRAAKTGIIFFVICMIVFIFLYFNFNFAASAGDKDGSFASQKLKIPIKQNFLFFSALIYISIVVCCILVFSLSIRDMNRSDAEQKLTVSGESLKREISTVISPELTLASKMADTPLIKSYFKNPTDKNLKNIAVEEFMAYKSHFDNESIFWINDIDKILYSTDGQPYTLDPDMAGNEWYNYTLYENTKDYYLDIRWTPKRFSYNVWVHAPVFDDTMSPIGIVGTRLPLDKFIDSFETIAYATDDVTKMYLINNSGEIMVAKNMELVRDKVTLEEEIGELGASLLARTKNLKTRSNEYFFDGNTMCFVSYLPSVEWYAIGVYPIHTFWSIDSNINYIFILMLFILLIVTIIFNIYVFNTEKSLSRRNQELTHANQSMSRFLATVSHEVRTPLNAILGITEIELSYKDQPERSQEAFTRIHSSGYSLLGIVNDVLDLSKIESDVFEIVPVQYDLPSLINDAVTLNLSRLGSKNIIFKLVVLDTLPAMLVGDEMRIKQILNNLLSNAFKYTEEGEVILRVTHEETDITDKTVKLVFVVSDTGQGMKPEEIENIFSEYTRFNLQTNRKTEGTGLGMSITKKLINLMGGEINVESEYGIGTDVTVTLVQEGCDDTLPIGHIVAQNLMSFDYDFHRETAKINIKREYMPYGKVLIVDDVETNIFVAKGLLLPYGLSIVTALTGFAAIKMIEDRQKFDIIFIDHMMPEMDGIETTKKIREMGYNGIIIALTANALAGNAEMFKQNGFDDFISKPIDIRILNIALNTYIRDKQTDKTIEKARLQAKTHIQANQDISNTSANQLMKFFRRDAKKAISVLDFSFKNSDYALFSLNAHSMKSALANIGETELSDIAANLETAGRNLDKTYISQHIESFIDSLKTILKNNEIENSENWNDTDHLHERFLREKLEIIIKESANYDANKCEAAINALAVLLWSAKAKALLDDIQEQILFSEFETAAEIAQNLLNSLSLTAS